jgi:hypothetical protein
MNGMQAYTPTSPRRGGRVSLHTVHEIGEELL